jgi:hypothetical protein
MAVRKVVFNADFLQQEHYRNTMYHIFYEHTVLTFARTHGSSSETSQGSAKAMTATLEQYAGQSKRGAPNTPILGNIGMLKLD